MEPAFSPKEAHRQQSIVSNATIALTTLVKAQFGTLITFPIFLYIVSYISIR